MKRVKFRQNLNLWLNRRGVTFGYDGGGKLKKVKFGLNSYLCLNRRGVVLIVSRISNLQVFFSLAKVKFLLHGERALWETLTPEGGYGNLFDD